MNILGRNILEQTLLFYPDMFEKGYIFCSNMTLPSDDPFYEENMQKLREYEIGRIIGFGEDSFRVLYIEEFPDLPAWAGIHEIPINAVPVFAKVEKLSASGKK